jgi:hypothetical protein
MEAASSSETWLCFYHAVTLYTPEHTQSPMKYHMGCRMCYITQISW